MNDYSSRMEEHLKKQERKKKLIPYLYGLLFLFTLALSLLNPYSISLAAGAGFWGEVKNVIFAGSTILLLPLIHIAISSLWESKRNNRTRRNIFLGWLGLSIINSLYYIYIFN